MKYKTVRSFALHLPDALNSLDAEVNILLEDGWVPCGGVAMLFLGGNTVEGRRYTVCQAVSKGASHMSKLSSIADKCGG